MKVRSVWWPEERWCRLIEYLDLESPSIESDSFVGTFPALNVPRQ